MRKYIVKVGVLLGMALFSLAALPLDAYASNCSSAKGSNQKRTISLVLKPNQGSEVKLIMAKNAIVKYQCQASGPIHVFVHGGAHDETQPTDHRYTYAQKTTGIDGTITAAFNGMHGWYLANTGRKPVTVQIEVEGTFQEIKRLF